MPSGPSESARLLSAPSVSVLVDSLIGYYALEPIVQELARRGCRLHLFAPVRIQQRLLPLLAAAGIRDYSLDDVGADAGFVTGAELTVDGGWVL